MILTGLPRSRTAWFSALLNEHGAPFRHELISGYETGDSYLRAVKSIGDCNTGLSLIYPYVHIDCPLVIIDNTHDRIKQIAKWSDSVYGGDSLKYMMAMEEMNRSMCGLHIAFDDINERAGEVVKYLTGIEPDSDIIAALININIQTSNLNFDLSKAGRLIHDVQTNSKRH